MYEEQSSRGVPSEKAQFEYAICLVRSKNKPDMDIKHGIALFEGKVKQLRWSHCVQLGVYNRLLISYIHTAFYAPK